MKNCLKCSELHEKPGAYCSRSCANSRSWTDEDKKKKSEANLGKCGRPGKRKPLTESHIQRIRVGSEKRSNDRFSKGLITERSAIRKLLTKQHGYKCVICNISDWQGNSITLQVDHKDGNAGNNMPENLRLICPNCHSQTATFGARNKGNGRKARGLPLK